MSEDHIYFDDDQAADFLHRKKSTIQTWRSRGHGPKYIRDGMNKVTYRKQDLIDFIEGGVKTNPADSTIGD